MAHSETRSDRISSLYLLKLKGKATKEELQELNELLSGQQTEDDEETDEDELTDSPRWAKTQKSLADEIGISTRQLIEWKKRDGFPAKTAKGYDVAAVDKFIRANRRDNAHREISPEEKEERAKMVRARRLLLELKLEQERGALVPAAAAAETVRGIYERQNGYLQRMLETEPPKIAKLGSTDEIREHIRGIINDMLADSRKYLETQNEKLKNE